VCELTEELIKAGAKTSGTVSSGGISACRVIVNPHGSESSYVLRCLNINFEQSCRCSQSFSMSTAKSSNTSSALGTLAAIALPVAVATIYCLFRRHYGPGSNGSSRNEKSKHTLRRNSTSHSNFTVIEEKATNAKVVANPQQVMGTWTSLGLEQPLVIAMVGLPARGKSYIVKMLVRYLKWNGYEAAVFNVGSYRRQRGLASADASFFSASNEDAHRLREEMAMHVLDSLYQWLHEPVEGSKGRVGIFDATNTTRARRLALAERAKRENVFLLFVESICDDEAVLQRNYSLKLNNDDYKKVDSKTAMKDFIERVQAYEKVYEVCSYSQLHDGFVG
jgi:predicted kinase